MTDFLISPVTIESTIRNQLKYFNKSIDRLETDNSSLQEAIDRNYEEIERLEQSVEHFKEAAEILKIDLEADYVPPESDYRKY